MSSSQHRSNRFSSDRFRRWFSLKSSRISPEASQKTPKIPKYILALHELLAHTPYEHVERKKLEYAKSKLEELSMVMHDEVSETENIRRNLSIERMIIEGCDILLDTSQVFVRQGMLLQVGNEKKYGGLRLGNFSSTFKEKEVPRKVFLFTHHLLIATRLSNGRLHLAKNYGKIPLAQCMLIEDTSAADVQLYEDEANSASNENGNNNKLSHTNSQPCNNAFRIIVQAKEKEMPSLSLTFVASTLQEKSAWCSDISQCMENLHYTDILSDSSSSNRLPQSVRVDPKAFTDDKSVKYCRTVNNSCKIPQIRHATVMKLLERLTDPRFLSIDFLNTFLLTYKVFTNSTTILDSLQRTVKTACNSRENDECSGGSSGEDVDQESDCSSPTTTSHQTQQDLILEEIAYESDTISQSQLKNKQPVYDPAAADKLDSNANTIMGLLHNSSPESLISGDRLRAKSEETESQYVDEKEDKSSLLEVCVTLKPCDDLPFIDEQKVTWREKENGKVSVSRTSSLISDQESQTSVCSSQDNAEQSDLSEDTDVFDNDKKCTSSMMPQLNQLHKKHPMLTRQQIHNTGSSSQTISPNLLRNPSPAGLSKSFACKSQIAGRSNSPTLSHINSSRSLISGCKHNLDNSPTASSVITSSRVSRRRCSSSAATTAFAVATAGASTAKYNRHSTIGSVGLTANYSNSKVNGTFTAVMRALNVIKHWISKYPQDFKQDTSLCCDVRNLLEDLICHPCLVPTEQKLAFNILKSLNKELEDQVVRSGDLYGLLTSPSAGVLDDIGTFETIAAIDIAEQITYLDHQIFMSISGEELLGLAWMKPDKHVKASHVIQASQRFNEVSQLVVTEIISKQNIQDRVTCIEKWAAIADILACTHNFNGVLQICAAFVNSSIYRLSKTWERLTKQTKQIISKLQNLVSSEGRFKNMREALHKCDNACIPYLGMYLSDLSFIEEGSPNFVEEGLVNYSKMRMITNVIREIQEYQQQTYTIQYNSLVCAYLLNRDRLLSDEETYKQSLTIEPRIVKTGNTPTHQPDKPVQQQA